MYNKDRNTQYVFQIRKKGVFMMTFNQILLAAKIEYHWWRIMALRKKKATASESRMQSLSAAENLHRYKAEITSVQYEISAGLRKPKALWV